MNASLVRSRRRALFHRRHEPVAGAGVLAEYESAVAAMRRAIAELDAARESRAQPPALQVLHRRVDDRIARAAQAAELAYTLVFAAAGGMHHAETTPSVIMWKRRMNALFSLRSQHQLAQVDELGGPALTYVRPGPHAAYGPHQAGMDFGDDEAASEFAT